MKRRKGRDKPERLYFGPSDADHPGLRPVTFELKWGTSLIDFKPTLTTANQVKSVTVNGWNRATKQTHHREGVTRRADGSSSIAICMNDLRTCDAREERVVDEPVFTRSEADERAMAILLTIAAKIWSKPAEPALAFPTCVLVSACVSPIWEAVSAASIS